MNRQLVRYIYLAIGGIFTTLGFIGAFLPVLPTTPFLLVAVWAFSKSSPRLKVWLHTHPRFGHHIESWFNEGAISKKAKIASVSLMGVSLGFSVLLSDNIYVPIALSVLMVAIATFILTRPTPSSSPVETTEAA
ncbi:YbaN family protein [Terasakiella pusilla]|uniref:YbaN family protein n=1 Tax=Terasakiella pusilla TaxID=64973 RepID=UPI00056EDE3D|nr:YbaN family protein [Terasakiella pusilla]